jgi:hypothetical protein
VIVAADRVTSVARASLAASCRIMGNYWSEDGDVLVHDRRSPIGWLVVFMAIVTIPLFFISVWVGVVGGLMLWSLFALQALADAERTEFDRRSKTVRKQSVLGCRWTDRLDHFTAVRVWRATTLRSPQIRVSLIRGDPPQYSDIPGHVLAVYASPGESDEKEAREWSDRLARFLQLPLQIDL